MNKSINTKHRPKTFEEMVGNSEIIESLQNVIETRSTSAFAFHGLRGTGKTSFARIVAKSLGTEKNNLLEYDVGDVRGIEAARDIKKITRYKVLGGESGSSRTFILDEVQSATKDFFNALLKTLEEPPPNNYFMLCTTDYHKLPAAIKSRCTDFTTQPLRVPQMMKLLKTIASKEEKDIDKDVLKRVAQISEGIPREGILLLNKLFGIESEKKIEKILKAHSVDEDREEIITLCKALIAGKDWDAIRKILNGLKDDPEKIRISIRGYMKGAISRGRSDRAAFVGDLFETPFYADALNSLYFTCYNTTVE